MKRDDHRSDRSLTVAARLDDVCADWGRTLDDLAAVDRLAGELGAYDDRLVCLGGHGDPLLHPDFAEVCRRLRAGGVAGVSVVTPLVELPEAVLEALFEHRVDVVEVQLDADSPETYERVHGVAAFSAVAQNLERLLKTREARQRPRPIVVCSLTRCVATAGEVETFFDRWIQRAQGAVIHGYNDYCGALPADGLLSMTPPVREPCRRLGSRLMLLADGCVPDCGQDFAGATRLGDWRQEPLREIWGGSARRALMEDHSRLDFSSRPACGRCGEWFRP